jgi:hypothetical protein
MSGDRVNLVRRMRGRTAPGMARLRRGFVRWAPVAAHVLAVIRIAVEVCLAF